MHAVAYVTWGTDEFFTERVGAQGVCPKRLRISAAFGSGG
jgi:hypothetical protein